MSLSMRSERIISAALKKPTAIDFTVVDRGDFPKGTRIKDVAFHCYYNGILFHWSKRFFYFKETNQ